MNTSAVNILICPNTLPSHGRGHKFETCTAHQNIKLRGSTPLSCNEMRALRQSQIVQIA